MQHDRLRNADAAAQRRASVSRRSFLRGLGACVALPAFESFLPKQLFAAPEIAAGAGYTPTGAPLRMAVCYIPNGVIQPTWWPKGEGADFQLARTMEPLESLKSKIQVLGGLGHVHATGGNDGPGDHARASGTFLTGVRVKKTAGSDIHAGVSIDQVVAQHVGHLTRFPSLELSCDSVRKSGNCDSGYSCAYQYNLAWRTPETPLSPEPNPRLVFERLFGAGSPGERRESLKARQAQQRSILDFVLDDARALEKRLGDRDQKKLDEYLTGVREIESRIERAERFGETPNPDVGTPPGIPGDFAEYLQLMFSMMVLAFETDSTRLATLILAHDGSNRTFPEIGIAEGHHYLSHHMNKKDMIEKVAEIDLWYAGQFAKFLQKLDDTKDVDGNSLLYNSMILYGGGNADGNRHSHVNLPMIVAGAGGGSLTPGRYLKLSARPMSNLFLSLADRFGVPDLDRFGDSTGRVTEL
jgi:hypothetical protein